MTTQPLGPLMIDLAGTELLPIEIEFLTNPAVGGIILFERNFANPNQLKQLVSDIRHHAPNLLIAVDHEGGSVWRFQEGFTKLPAMRLIGELYDQDPQEGLRYAETAGWILASELLSYGIDLSFTPVLDLDHQLSTVIKDRAFHSQSDKVTPLAKALILGMRNAGMKATGKHFPGHGGCRMDSHHSMTTDERALDTLWQQDLQPFIQLHPELGSIMTAHVSYPHIDPAPATYSPFWLQTLLREKIGFSGAIISDCLSMKGAALEPQPIQRIHRALSAGCDLLILCQQSREILQDTLSLCQFPPNPAREQRLADLHGDFAFKSWEKPKPTLGQLWELDLDYPDKPGNDKLKLLPT